jgi:hypothetical protein
VEAKRHVGGTVKVGRKREVPMRERTALVGIVVLNCALFGTELFAQTSQTVTPVPITPPSVNTTTLTCQINCDTLAMNCQNSCIPTTAAGAAAGGLAGGSGSCNLSCSTQQLVCKQRC